MTPVPEPPGARPDALGGPDLDVLRLLSEGWEVPQIAQQAGASPADVDQRLSAVCARMGVSTPIQAVVRAVHLGLI